MIKLSICIPTYNRCNYLKKNISIILDQIEKSNVLDQVEICISDNASTDDTEIFVETFITNNPQNIISYQKNEKNLGPDWNYIKAMQMASGEYSILWGDDDFFKNDGLIFILDLLQRHPDISIFFSNRTCIDANGNFVREQIFLRTDINFLIVDFKQLNDARGYFALSRDIACLFSFISSVIYKTNIVKERMFDESYINTQYAFLFYWWNHLMDGNKLLYISKSYLECTVNVKQAFGTGIDRVLVDYEGYLFIADRIFKDSSLKMDFMNVVNYSHTSGELRALIIENKEKFVDRLLPLLKKYGWEESELKSILEECSVNISLKKMCKLILPRVVLDFVRKIR